MKIISYLKNITVFMLYIKKYTSDNYLKAHTHTHTHQYANKFNMH